jgi:hypothetical protein
MGIEGGVLSNGLKWLDCEGDYSFPAAAKVKIVYSFTPTPLYIL